MSNPLDIPIIDPKAAAVDVGTEKLFASVGGQTPVVYLTVTDEVQRLCRELKAQGVKRVAMEATGVYWINLFGALEEEGFEVVVVNGAHCRNIPGRKTDMKDSQWLAVLHAHGLLRGGFVPGEKIRRLRDYLRLREDLVRMASQHVQHMQKALDRLNVKIHVVISDITGVSGMKILRAILAGERDARELARLCDRQILKTKKARMVQALKGLWQEEHLFALSLALQSYDAYQAQIAECDRKIAHQVEELSNGKGTPEVGKAKELRHNAMVLPQLQKQMAQIYGKDLTRLPCLNESTVTMLLGEFGYDMSPWKTWKHFGSWLGLAPCHQQSGRSRRRVKRHLSPAARILCRAVQCMGLAKNTWLGSFYRRIRGRSNGKVAIKATAYKLAKLIYEVLTKGWDYVEQGIAMYEQRVRDTQKKVLRKLAKQLDYEIVPRNVAINA
jgi:transposase